MSALLTAYRDPPCVQDRHSTSISVCNINHLPQKQEESDLIRIRQQVRRLFNLRQTHRLLWRLHRIRRSQPHLDDRSCTANFTVQCIRSRKALFTGRLLTTVEPPNRRPGLRCREGKPDENRRQFAPPIGSRRVHCEKTALSVMIGLWNAIPQLFIEQNLKQFQNSIKTGKIIKLLIKSDTIKPLLVPVRNPIWPLNKKRHVIVQKWCFCAIFSSCNYNFTFYVSFVFSRFYVVLQCSGLYRLSRHRG